MEKIDILPVQGFFLKEYVFNSLRNGKHAILMKTTVGNQDMQVWMKSLRKIPERLYGHERARFYLGFC